jgi:hypothetical protein
MDCINSILNAGGVPHSPSNLRPWTGNLKEAGAPLSGLWPALGPMSNQVPGLPLAWSGRIRHELACFAMHLRHQASAPEARRGRWLRMWQRLRSSVPPGRHHPEAIQANKGVRPAAGPSGAHPGTTSG